mmetsp:Transcript_86094/g.240720  ORF Transcript_86094/g.240720 Transcript_86094/m.240720 type:complete len:310 (-) Transcript_86094:621-1550(-)
MESRQRRHLLPRRPHESRAHLVRSRPCARADRLRPRWSDNAVAAGRHVAGVPRLEVADPILATRPRRGTDVHRYVLHRCGAVWVELGLLDGVLDAPEQFLLLPSPVSLRDRLVGELAHVGVTVASQTALAQQQLARPPDVRRVRLQIRLHTNKVASVRLAPQLNFHPGGRLRELDNALLKLFPQLLYVSVSRDFRTHPLDRLPQLSEVPGAPLAALMGLILESPRELVHPALAAPAQLEALIELHDVHAEVLEHRVLRSQVLYAALDLHLEAVQIRLPRNAPLELLEAVAQTRVLHFVRGKRIVKLHEA